MTNKDTVADSLAAALRELLGFVPYYSLATQRLDYAEDYTRIKMRVDKALGRYEATKSAPAVAVGEFVMVPKEPTAKMYEVAVDATPANVSVHTIKVAYLAMLSAAPTAPAQVSVSDETLREILAEEYERAGSPHTADMLRKGDPRALQHPSTIGPLAAMRRVALSPTKPDGKTE